VSSYDGADPVALGIVASLNRIEIARIAEKGDQSGGRHHFAQKLQADFRTYAW
jgi:hypothetical protein